LRAKAAPEAGESGDLPEVREELLDLALEVVDVSPVPGHEGSIPVSGYRQSMRRVIRLVLAAAGLLVYTWIAAVRSLPRVKARKARRGR
jgi:hypothetical protein